MGKKFKLKSGERKRVLWLLSDSIPSSPRFHARPSSDGELSGTIEVVRPGKTEVHPLEPDNTLSKGFWDFHYSIYVTPDQDCELEFKTSHFSGKILIIIILAILVVSLLNIVVQLLLS